MYDESASAQRTEPTSSAAVSAAELDRLLFRAPVRLIDTANDVLGTTRGLDSARVAVTAGAAASYFAHLAPGVAGVDIDLDDDDAAAAVLHQVAQWCDDHAVWWCTRRSGGGPGRWHLLAVAGELLPVLRGVVLELRQRWRLPSRELDWRTTLRPLTAPHRRTGDVSLPGDVDELLADLKHGPGRRRLGVAAVRQPRPRPLPSTDSLDSTDLSPAGGAVALSPGFWKRLRRPGPGYAVDRSLTELLVTAELKAAGYQAGEAWQVLADPLNVVGAHARSRGRGREWWQTYVWPVARPPAKVRIGGPRLPRTFSDGYDWQWLTLPLLAGVRSAWGPWKPRERHTTEHVAAVVTEYHTARRTLAAVPAAERTVAEDTGYDRDTARAALRRLCEANVLVLVERFNYAAEEGQGVTAHTYAPNLLAVDFRAGSLTPPPSSHTPSPAHPAWVGLPRGCLSLWTSLRLHGALPPTDLRTCAGYKSPANGQLSTRQRWLLEDRLQQMRTRGLITRTSAGGAVDLGQPTRPVSAPRAGWSRWRALRRLHAVERAIFRAARAADRARFRADWELGRARGRLRRAAADRERRSAWWERLGDAEREHRRTVWQAIYADLTPVDRARRRDLLRGRWAEAELYEREVMLTA